MVSVQGVGTATPPMLDTATLTEASEKPVELSTPAESTVTAAAQKRLSAVTVGGKPVACWGAVLRSQKPWHWDDSV